MVGDRSRLCFKAKSQNEAEAPDRDNKYFLKEKAGGALQSLEIQRKKKPAAAYFPPRRSIIGVRVLDFRVRNGNGYNHPTMATGI